MGSPLGAEVHKLRGEAVRGQLWRGLIHYLLQLLEGCTPRVIGELQNGQLNLGQRTRQRFVIPQREAVRSSSFNYGDWYLPSQRNMGQYSRIITQTRVVFIRTHRYKLMVQQKTNHINSGSPSPFQSHFLVWCLMNMTLTHHCAVTHHCDS